MPSSVHHLLASAHPSWHSVVRWGTRPSLDVPGLYLVSGPDPGAREVHARLRMSDERIAALLATRPEMGVGGLPADPARLRDALEAMLPEGEPVLYVGLAGTSVAHRVQQYYSTPIGARAPHAGGWPLKMLTDLNRLHVHVASAANPDEAEESALVAFMAGVAEASRALLSDPAMPLPFANLELRKGQRKRHGITGAKERRKASGGRAVAATPERLRPKHLSEDLSAMVHTLNVTEADIASGQIRVTREPKRALALPIVKTTVTASVRGESITASWNPRMGPDQERSGLLRIGKEAAMRLLGGPASVRVSRDADGCLTLE